MQQDTPSLHLSSAIGKIDNAIELLREARQIINGADDLEIHPKHRVLALMAMAREAGSLVGEAIEDYLATQIPSCPPDSELNSATPRTHTP